MHISFKIAEPKASMLTLYIIKINCCRNVRFSLEYLHTLKYIINWITVNGINIIM